MTSQSFSKAVVRGSRRLLTPYRKAVKGYCEAFRGKGVVLYGSPILEHAMSKYAIQRLIDEMLDVCPEIRPVNSPVDGRSVERYRGALIERHLPQHWGRGADIISTDGVDIELSPLKVPRRVSWFLGWKPKFNMVSGPVFVPPLKRKGVVSKEELRATRARLRLVHQ